MIRRAAAPLRTVFGDTSSLFLEFIIMAKTINTASVFAAFDRYAAALNNSRATLCAALKAEGLTTREAVQPYAIEWAAKRSGCPLVEGKRKAAGRVVLDRTHHAYEAARKAAQRLMDAFEAPERKVSAHKPAVQQVSRAQRAALMAALAEFDGETLEAQVRAAIKALRSLA